jgi:hypothetical protein
MPYGMELFLFELQSMGNIYIYTVSMSAIRDQLTPRPVFPEN